MTTKPQGPRLPTLAEVNKATARTAAVLADPDAALADLDQAVRTEAATIGAYQHSRSWQANLDSPGSWARAGLDMQRDGLEPEAAA